MYPLHRQCLMMKCLGYGVDHRDHRNLKDEVWVIGVRHGEGVGKKHPMSLLALRVDARGRRRQVDRGMSGRGPRLSRSELSPPGCQSGMPLAQGQSVV